MIGEVKWFNQKKGYGFIHVIMDDSKEEDIFVHYTSIEMDGYKNLFEDQKVELEIATGKKGRYAIHVKPFDD